MRPHLFMVALAAMALTRAAQADDELPTFTVLACKTNCADITPPEIIDRPPPYFPNRYASDLVLNGQVIGTYIEGLVRFRFTIGTDGHVHDIDMVGLIGPSEFADTARRALSQRLYKPAMRDGKPIAQLGSVKYAFGVETQGAGARPEMKRTYDRAIALAHDGKLDEAIAMLNAEQAKPDLNFYERDTMWYALALLQLQRKDLAAAHAAIVAATEWAPHSLPPDLIADALRLRIKIEARLGEIAYAFSVFDTLKKEKDFRPDEPIVAFMAALQKYLDGAGEIPVEAAVPDDGSSASWQHPLVRRAFRFDSIVGRVDRFELWCSQGAISSPVVETAQWHVPDDWGRCSLVVYGAPGATFQLHEAR